MSVLQVVLMIIYLSSALAADADADDDSEIDRLWLEFKAHYNKNYHGETDKKRKYIWKRTLKRVNNHNDEADEGKYTYWLGINRYADWTYMEKKRLRGVDPTLKEEAVQFGVFFVNNASNLPPHVDWREKGYVTRVKNQGQCGCCWSFAATGALEGQMFAKTGKLVSLSEKNLMDCSFKYGNSGCGGGMASQGYQYVIANGGIDSEKSYPFVPKDGKCRYNASNVAGYCKNYGFVHWGSEKDLKAASATIGPISVEIDTRGPFDCYSHGIYHYSKCSSTAMDHGVLVVGYGTLNGKDYWLIKNSWGPSWGMKGYFMLSRNDHNMCGVATQASYPVV